MKDMESMKGTIRWRMFLPWFYRMQIVGVVLLTAGIVRMGDIESFYSITARQVANSGMTFDECEGLVERQFEDMMDFSRYVLVHSEKQIFNQINSSAFNWDRASFCATFGLLLLLVPSFVIVIHSRQLKRARH